MKSRASVRKVLKRRESDHPCSLEQQCEEERLSAQFGGKLRDANHDLTEAEQRDVRRYAMKVHLHATHRIAMFAARQAAKRSAKLAEAARIAAAPETQELEHAARRAANDQGPRVSLGEDPFASCYAAAPLPAGDAVKRATLIPRASVRMMVDEVDALSVEPYCETAGEVDQQERSISEEDPLAAWDTVALEASVVAAPPADVRASVGEAAPTKMASSDEGTTTSDDLASELSTIASAEAPPSTLLPAPSSNSDSGVVQAVKMISFADEVSDLPPSTLGSQAATSASVGHSSAGALTRCATLKLDDSDVEDGPATRAQRNSDQFDDPFACLDVDALIPEASPPSELYGAEPAKPPQVREGASGHYGRPLEVIHDVLEVEDQDGANGWKASDATTRLSVIAAATKMTVTASVGEDVAETPHGF